MGLSHNFSQWHCIIAGVGGWGVGGGCWGVGVGVGACDLRVLVQQNPKNMRNRRNSTNYVEFHAFLTFMEFSLL